MTPEIDDAMKSINQHDACDDCGKITEWLMTCYYSHDDSTTKLCPDCIKDSGFCLRCGYYSAGIDSFDFSDMPGYCQTCREEIKADFCEDDEDDDFQPCVDCDLPDACADFGCAQKQGLKRVKGDWDFHDDLR